MSNKKFSEAEARTKIKSPAYLDIVSHSSKKSTEVEYHQAEFTIEVIVSCQGLTDASIDEVCANDFGLHNPGLV